METKKFTEKPELRINNTINTIKLKTLYLKLKT